MIVSNRVPLPRGGRPPEGGLASAVHAALEARGGLWFGWDGNRSPRPLSKPDRTQVGKVDFATLSLSRTDYDEYYRGFSNRTLWPLLHMRLDKMEYRRSFADGYHRVNSLFARALRPLLKPSDLIWVHDYHLFPLGRALRSLGCRQPMGFFLHVPFPPFDLFRALPGYRELLHAMGAYDLVGFQTDIDLLGFRNSVRHGIEGAKLQDEAVVIDGVRTVTGAFPISVDVDDLAARAAKARAATPVRRLVKSLRGRALVMGVDRLDYSKGLVERLRAFERLLVKHPHARGNVIMLQIAPPSRGDVPEYKAIRQELDGVAGEINGRFAEYDWTPLRYLNKGFARTTILGFLSVAKVGFVTPLRDGMNLVAKEFVAAQDPDEPGVLLLSELAGAARELREALLVHPYDEDDLADGLARSIAMPLDERKERFEAMLKTLRANDIHAWRRRFLEGLQTARGPAAAKSVIAKRPLELGTTD